jgi:hypothetical protein
MPNSVAASTRKLLLTAKTRSDREVFVGEQQQLVRLPQACRVMRIILQRIVIGGCPYCLVT